MLAGTPHEGRPDAHADVALIRPFPAPGERHGGWTGVASYSANLAGALGDAGARVTVLAADEPGEPAVARDGTLEVRRCGGAGPARCRPQRPRRSPPARPPSISSTSSSSTAAPRRCPASCRRWPRCAARGPVVTMHHVVDPRAVDAAFTATHRVRAPAPLARVGVAAVQRTIGALADAVVVHEPSFAAVVPGAEVVPHGIEVAERSDRARPRAPRSASRTAACACSASASSPPTRASRRRSAPPGSPATRRARDRRRRAPAAEGTATPSGCARAPRPTCASPGSCPTPTSGAGSPPPTSRCSPTRSRSRRAARWRSRSPTARRCCSREALARTTGAPAGAGGRRRPGAIAARLRTLAAARAERDRLRAAARARSRPHVAGDRPPPPRPLRRPMTASPRPARSAPGRAGRVFLAGAFGQGNPGDEALLAAFTRALRDHAPVAASTDPAATAAEHGIAPFGRDDLRVRRARGRARRRRGRRRRHRVQGAASLVRASRRSRCCGARRPSPASARRCGKPLALVGVGAAPLHGPRGARAGARDRARRRPARAARRGVGRPTWPSLAPRRRSASAPTRPGRSSPTRRPPRPQAPSWSRSAISPAGASSPTAWPRASRRCSTRTIPVRLDPWQRDGDAALAAAVVAGSATASSSPPPPADLLAAREAMLGARLVLAQRFHALVAAASAGVPALAVAHEAKLAGLARRLDQPAVAADAPPATLASAVLARSAPRRRPPPRSGASARRPRTDSACCGCSSRADDLTRPSTSTGSPCDRRSGLDDHDPDRPPHETTRPRRPRRRRAGRTPHREQAPRSRRESAVSVGKLAGEQLAVAAGQLGAGAGNLVFALIAARAARPRRVRRAGGVPGALPADPRPGREPERGQRAGTGGQRPRAPAGVRRRCCGRRRAAGVLGPARLAARPVAGNAARGRGVRRRPPACSRSIAAACTASAAARAPSAACSPSRRCGSRSASRSRRRRAGRRRRRGRRRRLGSARRRVPARACRRDPGRDPGTRPGPAGPSPPSCCSPSSRTRTCCSPTRCSTRTRRAASPCSPRSAASPRSRPPPCR